MNGETRPRGRWIGLLPLMVFLLLFVGTGAATGSFEGMPLLVALMIATAVGFFLKPANREKIGLEGRLAVFCQGAGNETLLLMVIIFLLAGAFYGMMGAMHGVDSVVNFGLALLPYRFLMPGVFLIGCLLSFAMGTSMGTIAALVPIAAGLAARTGISPAMMVGVAVGGAMFGDNLSFVSDTTIAATRTQSVRMKDKFRVNSLIVLPAVVLNLILLSMWQLPPAAAETVYAYNWLNMMPYALVILLSLIGINVIIVLSAGVVSGLLIGLAHGDFTLLEALGVIRDGMISMQETAIIAIIVGGMAALMRHAGGIDFLLYHLTRKSRGRRGAEASVAVLVCLMDLATTNNTIAILTAGPIARDIADEFRTDRRRMASILDLFSSALQGLIPFAPQLLVAGALSQVNPTAILPWNWYSMMMLVLGTVSILTGLPRSKNRSVPQADGLL